MTANDNVGVEEYHLPFLFALSSEARSALSVQLGER